VTAGAGERAAAPLARAAVVALSAYFVVVWGAGFVASRIALEHAAPFTYIGIRYGLAFGVAVVAFGLHARWPQTRAEWSHIAVAGLLSHAGYLGGSHYAQRWGLSAGVTALVLALQPLLTAVIVSRWLHERLGALQKVGVGVGLAGVALVVGERALAGTASLASVLAVVWSLLCVTAGTLYQRQFCAGSDLRAAVCIHFAATALLMLPLGVAVEGFAIAWSEPIALALAYHVVLGSIGAFSILHLLMRHGQATGVTSLLYLTPPVAALVEWAVYGVAPTLAMWAGMAIACVGVAMATVNAGRLARGTPVEERS
jgi:drug/metabolite transporter (DMT)-like permease